MKQFTLFLLCGFISLTASLMAQDAAPPPAFDPLAPPPAPAEEQEEDDKALTLSGYVDAYYQGNLSKADGSDDAYLAFPTSFTPAANTFGIGNVNLLAEKSFGKVSFVGQLGFGPRAVQANGGAGGNFASTVQQLYVTYSPSERVTFTLGNFGTFVGYEVIDAPANMNYSTSYLFSNGPFFHTGAKVDFALAEGFGAMLGVFNDTDTKIDGVSGKHYGAQLSAEAGDLAAYLNVLTGKEADLGEDDLNELQVDLTATYDVSETVVLGLNASRYVLSQDGDGAGGFFGTALYGTFGLTETATLSVRGEYFALTAAEGTDIDEPNVLSLTLSGGISVGDLRIIPEVRYDTGSNGFLNALDGDTYDPSDDSVLALLLAGVYSF